MPAPHAGPGPTVSRRGLLVGAAVLAAASTAAGRLVLDRTTNPLAALVGRGPLLHVGYVEGSGAEPGGFPEGARVRPAAEISPWRPGEGDGAVRIRVHGTSPGVADLADLDVDAVHLDLLLPVDDGTGAPVPFYAWSGRAGASHSRASRLVTDASADPAVGVAMSVRRSGGGTPAGVPSTALLGRAGAGVAALRPGTFLLGLDPDAWAAPVRLPGPTDVAWSELASLVVAVELA